MRTYSKIVLNKNIAQVGQSKKRMSNTMLDILLSLIQFNKENKSFFFFILKNLYSGFNKINWTRTIARTSAIVQGNEAIYLRPVNKQRKINFDEELLIIYFSILNYIREKYGFAVDIDCHFDLITGAKFDAYLKGMGVVRLRQIKYKYFSDKALRLWELCFAFFDRAKKVVVDISQKDYLLVKNFNIVFEAIIDELVGDRRELIPKGLKDQEDGKRVDHMYSYNGLTTYEKDKPVYYIGDSKYYKRGNEIGNESVYKQFTYARNVIQWNLNLFMSEDTTDADLNDDKANYKGKVRKLRDDTTEGYNIIPNFFISATMDEDYSYRNEIKPTERGKKFFISNQFRDRLFDRDTLLVCHYDVNFLYVVALYAQNNVLQKRNWKENVRKVFREQVQKLLEEQYDFYAMKPLVGVDDREYIRSHFQEVLGKMYRPYNDRHIYSLALDKSDPEGKNEGLLRDLRQAFQVVKLEKIDSMPEENMLSLDSIGEAMAEGKAVTIGTTEKNVLLDFVEESAGDVFWQLMRGEASVIATGLRNADIQHIGFFLPIFRSKGKCFVIGFYRVSRVSIAQTNEGFEMKLELGDYRPLLEYRDNHSRAIAVDAAAFDIAATSSLNEIMKVVGYIVSDSKT